jgi:hypothetical protein
MSQPIRLLRADFERVLQGRRELIHHINELEYQLYGLGDPCSPERMRACRQAAGALIGLLRDELFHQDQHILPVLEALIADAPP